MKNAIIIVNYNSANDTIEFVSKIKNYNIIDRIIVVDNLSTTIGAFEELKKLEGGKVSVVQSGKNGGYAYGNNFGVHYLEENQEQYDNIIISNSDIDIEESTIKRCIDFLSSNEKAAIAAPRMFDLNNNPARRSSWKIRTFKLDVIHSTRLLELLFYKHLRDGEYREDEYKNNELKVEAIAGSFFVVKYNVFKEIGYFDENVFLFYEEDILASKLRDAGYEVYSLNDVKFIHYESKTIKKSFNYFNKMKILYESKMYYQKNYNKINSFGIITFKILRFMRVLELLIEIPMRRILKK